MLYNQNGNQMEIKLFRAAEKSLVFLNINE